MLACFYRTSKFSLAWQEGRSRALLLELNTNEPDIAHKVGPYMHTCHLHVSKYGQAGKRWLAAGQFGPVCNKQRSNESVQRRALNK